jgi:integrase
MLKFKKIYRDDLIELCQRQYSEYGLAPTSKVNLTSVIRTLVQFMKKREIMEYTQDVGDKFLDFQQEKGLTEGTMKAQRRAIFLLQLKMEARPYATMAHRIEHKFPGEIGRIAEEYIEAYSREHRLSENSERDMKRSLSLFSEAIEAKGCSLSDLSLSIVKGFFSSTQNQTYSRLIVVRRFVSFLCREYGLDKDMQLWLQDFKLTKEKNIPSVYSADEIVALEKSFPRNSLTGKRNYAMVLLASRLGLRSGDIARLKFSDIDWDRNVINIIQHKTSVPVELPLLKDVGEALIDYIMNGRQKSDSQYIFLKINAPIRPINSYSVGNAVHRHLIEAGIDISGRKSGAHALRHSLATILLANETKLPVISGILGHTTTESTRYYLGVDVKGLLLCSHEVPSVESSFYEQKGGAFYE